MMKNAPSESMPDMNSKELGYIDGLRGLAILYTIPLHIRHLVDGSKYSYDFFDMFISKGGVAVSLFFAISSILNFHSAKLEQDFDSFNWKKFYIKRFF